MAGETALARQLKKLAVPQTSLLIQDKIRKSFLFDHRDAAALDRDIIFAYGTTGLEKLKIVNSMFGKYEHNLFSVSYKEFERSVQTFSVNKKLDEKINEFLRMLSPYLLIRAAHEALEWLIYRFHIHLYNADDLVASALPHFNTSTFVRVVQLLNLDDPNCRWAWLMPVQKSGVHLEYSAILNHFNTDGGFRRFLCELAPKSLSVFISNAAFASPVISFSMLTIYSALGKGGPITGDMITFLFPYILKGLKSSFNKYIAASYLVISKIISNVKITDDLVTEVLMKVFENVSVDLLKEAFELLLFIFQQQPIKKLTKELFELLISQKGCLKHLINMSENYEATSLLAAIFSISLRTLLRLQARDPTSNDCKKILKFNIRLINSARLSEMLAILCFKTILNTYSKFKFRNRSLKKTAKVLLKSLERKYPEYFDLAISNFFKKKQIKNKKHICKLINDSVCSVKNKILLDKQTTLVLGINHANSEVRRNSVRFLLEQTVSKQLSDVNFIEGSLHERLCDDSCNVVIEVLSSPKILLQYVDKKKILLGFGHIFQKRIDVESKWYPVQMLCMDILCCSFTDEEELTFEIFVALMPFIFPLTKKNAPGFLQILKSKLSCILPVIQVLEVTHTVSFNGEADNDKNQLVLLNMTVISSLKKYVEKLSDSTKSSFLALLKEKSLQSNNNSLIVMFIIASGEAIVSGSRLNEKSEWIQNLLSVMETFQRPNVVLEKFNVDVTEELVVEKCVNALWKNQFPGVIIYHTFHKIVKFTELECHTSTSNFWISKCDHPYFRAFNILTLLFDLCVRQINCNKSTFAENFKNLRSIFIDSQFQTTENLFGFLSLIWSNVIETVPVYLQVAALETAKVSCDRFNNLDWLFENYIFFISLLKAVASPHVEVRSTSLSLLSSLLQCSEKTPCASKSLAETVCDNREEILTDYRQCYYILNNWLNPAFELFGTLDSLQTQNAALENRYLILADFIKILSDETAPNSMKNHVLLCLQNANNVAILSAYVPIINKLFLQFKENEESMDKRFLDILELLLQKFTPKTAACLKDNCVETDTLFKCLEFVEEGNAKDRSIILFTLKILSRDFFTAIPSVPVQKKIMNILLNAYLTSESDVNIEIKKVLSKLCMYAYLILKDLQGEEVTVQKSATLRDMKKSRNKEGALPENSNIYESKMWKKITVLLEIIQNKSKLDKRELLIPELFHMLNKTLNFDTQSSVEYVRQLILSTIYNCCQHLGINGLDERQFQVELIVQCIRSSTNPKTHHQSLLLLNLAATMFPDYVLNNVMSIFTFMGSSLVRQDDSYSFQVITQTIETIVPSLLEASSHQSENAAVQIVASVIRVFVDSLSDIPRHRQLPLFSKLITTLDPSQYLWIPLGQICDQYATVFHDMTSDDINNWKVSPMVEFAVNLHMQFTPAVQIDTCVSLLNFLSLLPDSKESAESEPSIQSFIEPFSVANHSDQQLQIYKYNVLSYINIWISSQAFVSQVSELDLKAMNSLEEKYETLLEKVLHYLQHQRSLKLENSRNRHNLFPLLFDLVSHINALLPCNLFIRVVRRLLRNSEPIIQKKAIELLSCKLEQQQHLFKEGDHASLLKLLNPLLKVVRKYSDNDFSEGENPAVNQQTALYALHLLTKVIGSEFPSKFHKVLNVAIHILADNVNDELSVNALLCLAQLCSSLNVEVLPQLNTFMPIIVNLLTDYKILELNDCLILGIITALISLVKNLGVFLSSYMQSLVTSVCLLATKYLEVNKKAVYEKLLAFQTLLAKDVALRILLTAIEDSYLEICTKDSQAVIPLMQMLEEKLACCNYTDIEACSVQLQQFCILLLDFRNSYSIVPTTSPESSSAIEFSIFSVLKTFVMKLSINHFQGFFKKIYQWATSTEVKQKWRIFTFYGLTCELYKTLKNLFVVVAKFFLKHAASELDSNNSSKHDDVDFAEHPPILTQHLNNILDTLGTCFLNDDGHLLDKDTFESLMQPIVDQLENIFNDEKVYQERVSKHLSGCIAHFMAAVSDNALWKKLNYQILLKTRHDSPVVRFAAIQVIREVVTVMGDNYLVLLPESIPFLAEVMEDESSEVEHECQSVITEMEKILGEPIRKYF